jgi:hypothetical protein
MMKLCGWSCVLKKTSIYIGPLVDDQGHALSYTVTGLPEGIDVVYVEVAADGREPGAYLQGYIAYSNVASNAPPRDFAVQVQAGDRSETILWTIMDTNRLQGRISDFSGNEGDDVVIVLPRAEYDSPNLCWFVVTGLPPGLVYDYYYGAILGRIDYTAVTEEEGVKDFQVTVEFHEADVVDCVTFTLTVANVNPPRDDNGIGIVIYQTKELEGIVLLDEEGAVPAATSTPFCVAFNKRPETPVKLSIRSRPGQTGVPLLFRVYNPDYNSDERPWSEELEITLDATNWDSGVIIESTVGWSGNSVLTTEDTAFIEISPDPVIGFVPTISQAINLYFALLPAADQRHWRCLAKNLKEDAVFLGDLRDVPVGNGANDVQVAWAIARAHNRSITARYALAFTNLTRPEMPKQGEERLLFNPKMAWFGLAAFASDAAGRSMNHLANVEPPNPLVERPIMVRFINWLARGNQGVYDDIYWQALAYYFGGLPTVMRSGGNGQAWQLADMGRLEGAMYWFLHREQTMIIQPIYDQIRAWRGLAQSSSLVSSTGAIAVNWAMRTLDDSISLSFRLWTRDAVGGIPEPPSAQVSEILVWKDDSARMDRHRLLFGPDWFRGIPNATMKGVVGTWLDILDWAMKKETGNRMGNNPADALVAHQWIIRQMRMFSDRRR